VIGLAFTKTGLTRRLAYRMIKVMGDRSTLIVLGCLVITAGLTHLMAHTAVAATMFPLLMAVNDLYGRAQADQIRQVPLHRHGLRRRRGQCHQYAGFGPCPAAAGMFKEFTGSDVGFFDLPSI